MFATGRAFTPFARASLYSKLVELAGGTTADPHRSTEYSVDSVEALVAALNDPECTEANPANTSGPAAPPGAPTPTVSPRPQDWEEIGIGSLVLATVGVEDGWWESVVLGVNGEMLTLKWRDFPGERTFVRRRTELALLPVGAR